MGPEAPQYEDLDGISSVTNEDGTPYIPEMTDWEMQTQETWEKDLSQSEETGDEVTPRQLQGFLAIDIQDSFNNWRINAEQFGILKKEINKEGFSSDDFTRLNRMLEWFEEDNWIQKEGPDFKG